MSYQKLEQVDLEITDPEPIAKPTSTVKRVSLVMLAVAGVAVIGTTSKSYFVGQANLRAALDQTYCSYNADANVNVSIATDDDSRRLTGVELNNGVGNEGHKNMCFLYSYLGERLGSPSLAPAISCQPSVSRLCAHPNGGFVTHIAFLPVYNVPGDTATITVKDSFVNDDTDDTGSSDGCDKIYWKVKSGGDDDGDVTEGSV